VTSNRIFPHVSEIGTVSDKINVHVVAVPGLVASSTVYDSHIVVKEFLKNPSTEAASKSGVVWSKDGVRLYITDQTKNQVGG
jgi:hypothetical protein